MSEQSTLNSWLDEIKKTKDARQPRETQLVIGLSEESDVENETTPKTRACRKTKASPKTKAAPKTKAPPKPKAPTMLGKSKRKINAPLLPEQQPKIKRCLPPAPNISFILRQLKHRARSELFLRRQSLLLTPCAIENPTSTLDEWREDLNTWTEKTGYEASLNTNRHNTICRFSSIDCLESFVSHANGKKYFDHITPLVRPKIRCKVMNVEPDVNAQELVESIAKQHKVSHDDDKYFDKRVTSTIAPNGKKIVFFKISGALYTKLFINSYGVTHNNQFYNVQLNASPWICKRCFKLDEHDIQACRDLCGLCLSTEHLCKTCPNNGNPKNWMCASCNTYGHHSRSIHCPLRTSKMLNQLIHSDLPEEVLGNNSELEHIATIISCD